MIPVRDLPTSKFQPRKLANSTLPRAQLNAIALVAVYSIYGLDDADICELTKLSLPALGRIRASTDYREFTDDVVGAIVEAEQEDVRLMLAQSSMQAARTLITKLHSPDSTHALRAADSILDRAGHRPVDVHLHRVQLENTLSIRIVEPVERHDAIDVEYTDANP